MEAGGGVGGVLLALGFLGLLALGLIGKRWWLVSLFVFALMFASYHIKVVDVGSVLVRWLVMFVLAITCIRGMRYPGLGAVLMSGVAVIGIVTAPLAPSASWAVQHSGLLLVLTFPMAAAIAHQLRTMLDITTLLKILLVCAGIWVVIQMPALGAIAAGKRFGGVAGEATGLFAFTGGLMLPVTLWGLLGNLPKPWRVYCGVTGTLILLLILLSGSRTGTFSGAIACLPLAVARFGVKKVLLSFLLVIVGLGVVWGALSYMPKHKEFLLQRYISTKTTGRVERWEAALAEVLESPFVGRGVGGELLIGFGPHNVYLIIWLTHGVLGLMLFVAGLIVMLFQSVRLMGRRFGIQVNEIGRLFCGIMVGSIAAGFFEGKMNSPSNVIAFFVILTSVVVHRTAIIAKQSPDMAGAYDQPVQVGASEYEFEELLRQYYGS